MVKSHKQQLLLMGFEDWIIDQALEQNKGQGLVRNRTNSLK